MTIDTTVGTLKIGYSASENKYYVVHVVAGTMTIIPVSWQLLTSVATKHPSEIVEIDEWQGIVLEMMSMWEHF